MSAVDRIASARGEAIEVSSTSLSTPHSFFARPEINVACQKRGADSSLSILTRFIVGHATATSLHPRPTSDSETFFFYGISVSVCGSDQSEEGARTRPRTSSLNKAS